MKAIAQAYFGDVALLSCGFLAVAVFAFVALQLHLAKGACRFFSPEPGALTVTAQQLLAPPN